MSEKRVVKQVEKFKYLGTLLSMDGSLKSGFWGKVKEGEWSDGHVKNHVEK